MEQLFILVEHGNCQLLHDILLQNPGIITEMNKDGDTLLHACVCGNQPRMVEFLLMVGKNNDDFDIDAYGCSNRTPLHYAAFEGHTECASILLNNGAAYSYLDSLNENPFHKCAANGHLECLALLVNANRGHNSKRIINQQNVLGSTPLHRAMERGNQQCAMLLMEAGADPNIRDFFGDLPVFTPKPIPKEYLDHIYAPFGK